MTMTAVIGLGILAWILVAVLVALFVARVIRLRDHRHPGWTEPEALTAAEQGTVPSRSGGTGERGKQGRRRSSRAHD